MRKRYEKVTAYPFARLDEITEWMLNPLKEESSFLTTDEVSDLHEQFGTETRQVLRSLKTHTFWILSAKKRRAVVQQYMQAVQLLKKQASLNQQHYLVNSTLQHTGEAILNDLNELSRGIEQRYMSQLQQQADTEETRSIPAGMSKIICELSIDQMGIILKAADDIKLIVSRSLSMIFKSIVPHLSTANKRELSWDSMRSNSYHPEERDKEMAIAALEKLIRKIREYR
ncbi:hypothetical protein [Mucilaginibacter sp. SP1R1]|uniref:hypothetical protein n=1 Tax=Mucilaginibacter sp. SP1R1 TaxID=2723091 RepID=UPI0016205F38|nr:hypothetical protein [Mucilaginibacter sp. SP1R1]MBB6152408.1 hypothetical protein [Mucilaginibacter sp. SP1R1]